MKDIMQLTAFIDKITKKTIPKLVEANKKTAKVILKDIKASAPKDTGEYASSIRIYPTKVTNNSVSTTIGSEATVSSLGGKAYNLGMLLETGTSPHMIYPVNSKYLVFKIGDKTIFTKKVKHPGTVSQPHYKPALDKNAKLYLDNIRKALEEAKE